MRYYVTCIYRDEEKGVANEAQRVSLGEALNLKQHLSCSSSAHGSFQFLTFHWEDSRVIKTSLALCSRFSFLCF